MNVGLTIMNESSVDWVECLALKKVPCLDPSRVDNMGGIVNQSSTSLESTSCSTAKSTLAL